MDAKDFKALFNDVALAHGFQTAYGGWYRELPVGLFVVSLQKSNFGNYFEANLKLFLNQTASAGSWDLKKCVKSMSGDIFRRQPEEYRRAFDLDLPLESSERRAAIGRMFDELIDHVVRVATGSSGLLRLRDEGVFFILPAVEKRLSADLLPVSCRKGRTSGRSVGPDE
ncbi:MAG TPA: DUF4304 domain-containing protein [Woeseiaceae bacterium]